MKTVVGLVLLVAVGLLVRVLYWIYEGYRIHINYREHDENT